MASNTHNPMALGAKCAKQAVVMDDMFVVAPRRTANVLFAADRDKQKLDSSEKVKEAQAAEAQKKRQKDR